MHQWLFAEVNTATSSFLIEARSPPPAFCWQLSLLSSEDQEYA